MDRFRIPTLVTGRLILRPLAASDLDAFAAMQADPEVMRHLGTGETRSRAETWDMMARMLGQWPLRGYGMFAVEEAASRRFAGRAGLLHPFTWPGPELAYGFDAKFWGKGYATECARALLDWAWAERGLDRLISFVRPANAGSVGVLRKLGARLVEEREMLGAPAQVWEHLPPAAPRDAI
jgi:RimJ/RimL family protein N-acetyltransferase